MNWWKKFIPANELASHEAELTWETVPFSFFKLLRIQNLLIIAFAQLAAASFLVFYDHPLTDTLLNLKLWILVVSTLLIAAAGYIINDYYDVKIDFINKPKRVVIGKTLTRRKTLIVHTAFNVMGIGLGLLLSWKIGAVNFIAATLLWLYSNQLKRWPLIGNITISFLTGLSIFVIAILFDSHYKILFIYSYFAGGVTLFREIIKDMEDVKGDRYFGCKTLPIVLGLRRTKYVIYVLLFAFIMTCYFLVSKLHNLTLTWYFLFLILPGLYFLYRLYRADRVRDFSFLSNFCKIIMLTGIVSMVFFNQS